MLLVLLQWLVQLIGSRSFEFFSYNFFFSCLEKNPWAGLLCGLFVLWAFLVGGFFGPNSRESGPNPVSWVKLIALILMLTNKFGISSTRRLELDYMKLFNIYLSKLC